MKTKERQKGDSQWLRTKWLRRTQRKSEHGIIGRSNNSGGRYAYTSATCLIWKLRFGGIMEVIFVRSNIKSMHYCNVKGKHHSGRGEK
jgi:hypothetical protein